MASEGPSALHPHGSSPANQQSVLGWRHDDESGSDPVAHTSIGLFIRGSDGYGEAKCDASHAGRYLRSVRMQLTKHRR
jgi:hypothetical protein